MSLTHAAVPMLLAVTVCLVWLANVIIVVVSLPICDHHVSCVPLWQVPPLARDIVVNALDSLLETLVHSWLLPEGCHMRSILSQSSRHFLAHNLLRLLVVLEQLLLRL